MLIGDIKGFKTYIYDIIVLSKDCSKKHTDQFRIIFGRLRAEGLFVNYPKCQSGLNEITYLDYVITQEGIKPYPKKVQRVMDIGTARHFYRSASAHRYGPVL